MCGLEHRQYQDAEQCEAVHRSELPPVLSIGDRAIWYEYADPYYGENRGMVVAIKGEDFDRLYLMETRNGERRWIRAVDYQIMDHQIRISYNASPRLETP